MTSIHIPKTELTPLVIFEPWGSVLKLEGKMIPEDVETAFSPINQWIEDYLKEDKPLNILIRLYYYNTSSLKRIFTLCRKLDTHFKEGRKLSVKWEYEAGDENTKSDIEQVFIGVAYPYQIVPVEV